MKIKSRYANYDNCYLLVGREYGNDNLRIVIQSDDKDDPAPIVDLTLYLDGMNLGLRKNEAYVDTHHFPEALSFIKEYKLGRLTGFDMVPEYWWVYPLVEFDMNEVKKYERK